VRPLRVGWLLLAIALVYYFSYQHSFGLNLYDEGYILEVSRRVAAGDVLYRDIRLHYYLPGLFYACALAQLLTPWPLATVRALCFVGMAVRLPLLYACLRRFTGTGTALLALAVALTVPGAHEKFYVSLLGVWILAAALAWLERPTARRGLGYGLAWGAALSLRLDQGLIATGLLGVLAVAFLLREPHHRPRPRAVGAVFGGMGLAALPVQLALVAQGVAGDHIGQWAGILGGVGTRLSEDARLPPPPLEFLTRSGREGLTALGYYLGLAVVLGLAAIAIIDVVRHLVRADPGPRERLRVARWLVAAAWAVPALLPWAFERPDVDHLVQYGCYVYLPAALVAARTGRPGRLLLGLAALVFLVGHQSVWLTPTRRAGRYPGPVVGFSNGRVTRAYPGQGLDVLIERILAETRPEERVEVIPYRPGINFLAERRSVSPDLYLAPHSVAVPGALESYLAAMRVDPPRFVVLFPGMSFNGRPSGSLQGYAPEVLALLEERYHVVAEQWEWRLLRLRELSP
jgi:hypothetical protein